MALADAKSAVGVALALLASHPSPGVGGGDPRALLQLEEVREIHSQIGLSELKYGTALPVEEPA